jgi:capsular polysaccharide biosynthesis protein
VDGQTLDLARSARIVWRHKVVVGAIVALGLIGSTVHTALQPPVFSSSTLIALVPSVNVSTQTVVVTSEPVLSGAVRAAHLGVSYQALRRHVRATRAAAQTLFITADGDTAAEAERTANAVSQSYIRFITSARNPLGAQQALLEQPATTATVKPFTTRVEQAAGAGLVLGALTGIVGALAIWRRDRRLRERDSIADSIGVPVLASVRARSPSDAAGWERLFRDFEPGPRDAWLLRKVLRQLSLATAGPAGANGEAAGSSVAVLSISGDRDALALGPQLAAFAAAQGTRATLLAGPQQDEQATAPLRAACAAAPSGNPQNLQLLASGDDTGRLAAGRLTVVVGVVDGQAPRVSQTAPAATTLLGVTAGAVTAQQLARVAASAAGEGRDIAAVLVANPVKDDQTTGRLPQLARPEQHHMPTRMVGVVTGSRL